MNISKQIEAIKNCLTTRKELEITHLVSTYDTNVVSYYITFAVGKNSEYKRKFEVTVCKSKIIWIVTDEVGIDMTTFDSLRKAIREAK